MGRVNNRFRRNPFRGEGERISFSFSPFFLLLFLFFSLFFFFIFVASTRQRSRIVAKSKSKKIDEKDGDSIVVLLPRFCAPDADERVLVRSVG